MLLLLRSGIQLSLQSCFCLAKHMTLREHRASEQFARALSLKVRLDTHLDAVLFANKSAQCSLQGSDGGAQLLTRSKILPANACRACGL